MPHGSPFSTLQVVPRGGAQARTRLHARRAGADHPALHPLGRPLGDLRQEEQHGTGSDAAGGPSVLLGLVSCRGVHYSEVDISPRQNLTPSTEGLECVGGLGFMHKPSLVAAARESSPNTRTKLPGHAGAQAAFSHLNTAYISRSTM